MKKLLTMLLALSLLALCACTSKSNTTAEVPETMTETPSEETEPVSYTHLTLPTTSRV